MKKNLFSSMVVLLLTMSCMQQQESNDMEVKNKVAQTEVLEAVEVFRKTMLVPTFEKFNDLTFPNLSYGHSSGFVEDRETFMSSMLTGKFKFTELTFSDQAIDLQGSTAVVRHTWYGHTADEGKEPGTVRLHVVLIWYKENGVWRLLARQAVKI